MSLSRLTRIDQEPMRNSQRAKRLTKKQLKDFLELESLFHSESPLVVKRSSKYTSAFLKFYIEFMFKYFFMVDTYIEPKLMREIMDSVDCRKQVQLFNAYQKNVSGGNLLYIGQFFVDELARAELMINFAKEHVQVFFDANVSSWENVSPIQNVRNWRTISRMLDLKSSDRIACIGSSNNALLTYFKLVSDAQCFTGTASIPPPLDLSYHFQRSFQAVLNHFGLQTEQEVENVERLLSNDGKDLIFVLDAEEPNLLTLFRKRVLPSLKKDTRVLTTINLQTSDNSEEEGLELLNCFTLPNEGPTFFIFSVHDDNEIQVSSILAEVLLYGIQSINDKSRENEDASEIYSNPFSSNESVPVIQITENSPTSSRRDASNRISPDMIEEEQQKQFLRAPRKKNNARHQNGYFAGNQPPHRKASQKTYPVKPDLQKSAKYS